MCCSVGAKSCTPVICRRLFGMAPATAWTVTTLSTRCSGSGPLKFGTWPKRVSPPVRISKKRCFCGSVEMRRTMPVTVTHCASRPPARSASSDGVVAAGTARRPRTCSVSAISDGAKPPVSVTPWISTSSPTAARIGLPCVFTKMPAVPSCDEDQSPGRIDVGDDAAQVDAMAQRRVDVRQLADAGGVGEDRAGDGRRVDQQQVGQGVDEQLGLLPPARRRGGAERDAADANLLADEAGRVGHRARADPDDERLAVRLQDAAPTALRHPRFLQDAADLDAPAVTAAVEDVCASRQRPDHARVPGPGLDDRRGDEGLLVADERRALEGDLGRLRSTGSRRHWRSTRTVPVASSSVRRRHSPSK